MTLYKLQIGCIVVFFYIVLHYLQSKNIEKKGDGHKEFYAIIILSAFYYVFDILTVYTVNHLEIVPPLLNRIVHACYLCSLNALEYLVLYYLIKISGKYLQIGKGKFFLWTLFGINIAAVLLTMGKLYYVNGVETNYSMGIPAYITYGMCMVYVATSIAVFIQSWNYFEKNKRKSIGAYLTGMVTVLVVQSIFPETLISCLGITLFILAIYINIENPYIKVLIHFQGEFSVGMADIVEYRDNNTGGHIRRTAAYAEMLAKEMRRGGVYRRVLTKDFVDTLRIATPLHDIGKVAVPDMVLQKPGKLTDEENEQIKQHTVVGAEMIKNTLKNVGNEEFYEMAYQIAKYHHEKWNGKGYPNQLKGTEIPLSARITAVADVFDAISQKRCYRDAMSLEECYKIIEDGKGTDFEPCIVEAFMRIKDKIGNVCMSYRESDAE